VCGYQLITTASTSASSAGAAAARQGTDPAYSTGLQFFKSRQIGWVMLVQLLGSAAYVFASNEAQNSATGAGAAQVADTSASGGIDWSILQVWRQRWSRRCVRALHQVSTGISSAVSRVVVGRSMAGVVEGSGVASVDADGGSADADAFPDITDASTSASAPVRATGLIPTTICVLCGASPVEMSQMSACGHNYCYVCIFACCQQNHAWGTSRGSATSHTPAPGNTAAVAACLCPVCDAVVCRSDDGL